MKNILRNIIKCDFRKDFTSICISLLYSLGCSEIDRKTAEPQEPTKRILKRAQQIVRQGQAQWVEHKCISIRHRIHSGLTLHFMDLEQESLRFYRSFQEQCYQISQFSCYSQISMFFESQIILENNIIH